MHAARPVALFLALAAFAAPPSHAQHEPAPPPANGGFDSTRVLDLTHQLTLRLFMSTKFNAAELRDAARESRVTYRPNTNVNLGVGVSYRALTLNLGFGFGFLNGDDAELGDTRYLDAQGNMFGRRFAINLFAQSYKGYYIDVLNYPGSMAGDTLYDRIIRENRLRPDLVQENLGLSMLHIVGNRRFSYRAAFNQDAWQLRSAGAMLVGGYGVFQALRSDRPEIPQEVDSLFAPALRFRRLEQAELGGLLGYAHTFVIKRHVFIALSIAGGVGLVRSEGWYPEHDTDRRDVLWGAGLRSQQRIALGYNSARTCVGLSASNETSSTSPVRDATYGWNVGNVRLFVAYRIPARIGFVDKAMGRLGLL
ncbi:MAG: DUF4421 family protein [Flavobacteriales bacterium]|nr:hypothetical protein [Flavobacteriales bacterium]MCC6577961.1 DUF4421 family protein [Flavobacteriales bacterium]NUQ14403.1 DUF4421 family protein [Flavobacteriales bacterium]